MNIFVPIIEDSPVSHYRLLQPLQEIARRKLARIKFSHYTGQMQATSIDREVAEEGAKWCDILFTNTAKNLDSLVLIMAMRDYYKKPLVVDVDDNLVNINKDHPAFEHYSNPDLKISQRAQETLQYADLITCSTSNLQTLYSTLGQRFYINPNATDLDDWDRRKKKNKKLRIGWVGAMGHFDNLRYIQKPIDKIVKEFDVEFVTFGVKPSEIQSEHHGWVDFDHFKQKYHDLNLDIIVAPLLDNLYNRGKSNLRLIEAGAQKIPCVASPTEPYKNFPCLHALDREDWYNQLAKLIKDKKLRIKLGEQAYIEVKNNYNIKLTAPKLLKEFKALLKVEWKLKE